MPLGSPSPGIFDVLGGAANVLRLVVVAAGSIGLILFVAFVTARLVAARIGVKRSGLLRNKWTASGTKLCA